MVVSQDVVKKVMKKFESHFLESVAQIERQWDKLKGGNIEAENASLWAWIFELENGLGWQANSST